MCVCNTYPRSLSIYLPPGCGICCISSKVIMNIFPTNIVVHLPLAQHYLVALMESTVLPNGLAAGRRSPSLLWCTCIPLLSILHKLTIKCQSTLKEIDNYEGPTYPPNKRVMKIIWRTGLWYCPFITKTLMKLLNLWWSGYLQGRAVTVSGREYKVWSLARRQEHFFPEYAFVFLSY